MEELNEENLLELRMYFFTIYQLTGIQKGIQAGHSALRYIRQFAEDNPEVWEFIDNHETWIILDGGTTNDDRDFDGISIGTLNHIADKMNDNDIKFSYFHEPDLNNSLTSICFLCDERVFNKKDYPDFVDFLFKTKCYSPSKSREITHQYKFVKTMSNETQQEDFPETYKEWVRFVGGVKNVFLRELIKNKKLA